MTTSPQNRSLRRAAARSGPTRRAGLAALTLAVAALAPLGPSSAAPSSSSGAPAAAGAPALPDAVAGPSALTPEARAEIARVLAEGTTAARLARGAKAQSPAVLAKRLIRCATFEEQRYCLGLGWTQATPADAAGRFATAAQPLSARASREAERTGDVSAAALLKQRARLSPEALARLERVELRQAARSVAKIWLLRHQIQGTALPDGFLARHPEVRTSAPTALARGGGNLANPVKTVHDYPEKGRVLNETHVNDQRMTYWCGPTTMQMIAWTKKDPVRKQRYWAKQLGTTTSGTGITDMVRVINSQTNWDKPERAGTYVVLDISDLTFGQWTLLIRRHVWDYRAPMVFHPVLLKEFYPYLDDDASGHYQVGRGYDNNPTGPTKVSFFEPWNQQRFDPSEPFIERVQWRSAYKSYRANQEHHLHNMGV